jgi:hypothetical protein
VKNINKVAQLLPKFRSSVVSIDNKDQKNQSFGELPTDGRRIHQKVNSNFEINLEKGNI